MTAALQKSEEDRKSLAAICNELNLFRQMHMRHLCATQPLHDVERVLITGMDLQLNALSRALEVDTQEMQMLDLLVRLSESIRGRPAGQLEISIVEAAGAALGQYNSALPMFCCSKGSSMRRDWAGIRKDKVLSLVGAVAEVAEVAEMPPDTSIKSAQRFLHPDKLKLRSDWSSLEASKAATDLASAALNTMGILRRCLLPDNHQSAMRWALPAGVGWGDEWCKFQQEQLQNAGKRLANPTELLWPAPAPAPVPAPAQMQPMQPMQSMQPMQPWSMQPVQPWL